MLHQDKESLENNLDNHSLTLFQHYEGQNIFNDSSMSPIDTSVTILNNPSSYQSANVIQDDFITKKVLYSLSHM